MDKKVEKQIREVQRLAGQTIKTSLNLTKDLWREIKVHAARQGLTLTEVVTKALNRYLELEEKKEKRK
ncbi:MAG: hypothetical protein U9M97_00305 [Candidatus Hadarchaeota archaeon]|nr:hypothetical protein [Candidatus Hadarchaeota archaeon]